MHIATVKDEIIFHKLTESLWVLVVRDLDSFLFYRVAVADAEVRLSTLNNQMNVFWNWFFILVRADSRQLSSFCPI